MKKAGNIGDVIFLKSESLFNVSSINGFTDDVAGEDVEKYFVKRFRYSTNGVDFSDWLDLSQQQLSSLSLNEGDLFFAEFSYTRAGDDSSGILEVSYVYLDADFYEFGERKAYDSSFFNNLVRWHDSRAIAWSVNVLRKVSKDGILPKFISRSNDYVSFWRSVTDMFSWIVNYARMMSYVEDSRFLLRKFLNSRSYFYSKDDSLQELNSARENIYNRISRRGTKDFKNVELRNLLDNNFAREYIFELSQNHKIGWNVNNSSPLYRGFEGHIPFVKGYEKSEDVLSLAPYPLMNEDNISLDQDGDKNIMLISSIPAGSKAGISTDGNFVQEIAIPVSVTKDYRFSVSVKPSSELSLISMGIFCFDQNENLIATKEANTANDKNFFFESVSLNRNDIYYRINGILFSAGKEYDHIQSGEPIDMDMGIGTHLEMPEGTSYVLPYFLLDNSQGSSSSGDVKLHNICFSMLNMDKPLSFVDATNFIQAFLVNGSGKYTDRELEEIVEEYLKPYNSHVIYNWLDFDLDSDVVEPPPTPTGSTITIEEGDE